MSFIRSHVKLIAIAAAAALIGAGASVIASASAATSSSPANTRVHAARALFGARWLLGRSVHGDLVVATRSGFANVTFDRGIVQSVSGQQLTLTEGTKTRTYKIVTLTIPTNARIRDNGHIATLADVTAGQRVLVVQGPEHTLVVARTALTP